MSDEDKVNSTVFLRVKSAYDYYMHNFIQFSTHVNCNAFHFNDFSFYVQFLAVLHKKGSRTCINAYTSKGVKRFTLTHTLTHVALAILSYMRLSFSPPDEDEIIHKSSLSPGNKMLLLPLSVVVVL
jgi:hypothetical protein